MKIHIETLLQRLEDLEKRHKGELSSLENRVCELLRDKSRMEQLLDMREKELHDFKRESATGVKLLEQAKV
jgi:hypothetical protein